MCSCDQTVRSQFGDRAWTPVTARKEHRCIECSVTISPGEKYSSFSYGPVWSPAKEKKVAERVAMCHNCHVAWFDFLATVPGHDQCVVFGELKSCLREALDSGDLDSDHPLIKQYQISTSVPA